MTIDWKEGMMAVVALLIVFAAESSGIPFWRPFLVIVAVWWLQRLIVLKLKVDRVRRLARDSIKEMERCNSE